MNTKNSIRVCTYCLWTGPLDVDPLSRPFKYIYWICPKCNSLHWETGRDVIADPAKPYQCNGWLFHMYWGSGNGVTKCHSTREIASITGVSHTTIVRWLHKHNILPRSRSWAADLMHLRKAQEKGE